MLAEAVKVTQGLSLWQAVVYPALTLLITGGGVYLAAIPILRRRKAAEQVYQEQRALERLRTAAANNAVLGEDADPNIGRHHRVPGLVDTIEDVKAKIGVLHNGDTLAGAVEEVKTEQGRVAQALNDHEQAVKKALEADQHAVKTQLANHEKDDDRRFQAMMERLPAKRKPPARKPKAPVKKVAR